jgi:hypothetical protein
MENNIQELHVQKVAILSRLIKESSLTLEEALTLLKEEEPKQAPINFVSSSGTAYHPPLGTWSSTTNYPSFLSMGTNGTSTVRTTTFTNTAADDTAADLNN